MNRFAKYNEIVKAKKKQDLPKTKSDKLLEFIVKSIDIDYLDWCSLNGFQSTTRKTENDLKKEIAFIKDETIKLQIKSNNIHKKKIFKDKINEYIQTGKSDSTYEFKNFITFNERNLASSTWRNLATDIFSKDYVEELPEFKKNGTSWISVNVSNRSLSVTKKTIEYFYNWILKYPILEEICYKNPGLVLIVFIFRDFLNKDLNSLKFKSKNYHKNEMQLITELFVKYKVPKPMLGLFTESTVHFNTQINYMLWGLPLLFDMTMGKAFHRNWGKYKILSGMIPLNNKEVWHFFNHKNLHFEDFGELFMYAKLAYLDIDQNLIQRLMYLGSSVVVREQNYSESWVARQRHFIDFMVFINKNKDAYDVNRSVELWDYMLRGVLLEQNGTVTYNTNFFRNLTINQFYDQMIEWHDNQNHDFKKKDLKWEKDSSIEDTSSIIYAKVFMDGKEQKMESHTLSLFELTSYVELKQEGDKMQHCVASYADQCAKGSCRIFTVRKKDMIMANDKHTATIEVVNRRIVQIKAKRNQPVDESTMDFIKKWAAKNKLGLKEIYC